MGWQIEEDPLETMKKLLNDNWRSYAEVPKPTEIIVQNETDNPISRLDLNLGDSVIIKMDGSELIRQRANFTYFERVFPIVIEFYTKQSRSQLRNIGKMIRAICTDRMHSFDGYQLIRLKDYTEAVEENLNIWRGTQRLQVESAAVCAEKPI
jgi:hypothetical protein